jgi:hypothetical protein
MLELSNENLSTAKASNSLTTKAKSLVACGRLKPNSVKAAIAQKRLPPEKLEDRSYLNYVQVQLDCMYRR